MIHLALSCLQGRPMQAALEELGSLGTVGIQLTPGCVPTPGFALRVLGSGLGFRTHHGFSWSARRQPVWEGPRCLVRADSVHPPPDADAAWLEAWVASGSTIALEPLYPGEGLGTGALLDQAMRLGVRLAVDISHLHIQRMAGVLDDAVWQRVQDYDRIAEVHVSANDGQRDLHQLLDPGTFGLAWARARLHSGTPVIYEAYLHNVPSDVRRAQVDLLAA